MGLKERLQKQLETSDTHKNEKLRTHYYAATAEMLFTGLEAVITRQEGTVKRIDQGRGELAFSASGLDGLATVIMVGSGRTAVDLFLHRDGLLGPDLEKWIDVIYQELDATYRLKMIGTREIT
ncbi:hypothetical protein D3D03_08090 [Exiguobacterium sp. RIT452]|uniref:hypothetical protein n=1 Tax=Exiguobacterium sp. RIT452 TaxID=2315552 RepID=UPI000E728AEB|nr:hypothetical protein [Exiguobacterium sp. RIT452]RJP00742.1 hypothetical protein D3D03_08090 [Exiguobacterium sp. RIT452]